MAVYRSPLLDRIFERFAPRVTIDCDPEAFTFALPDRTAILKTFMYLEKGVASAKILAIGTDFPVSSEKIFKVSIFNPTSDPENPRWLTTEYLLNPFVRHGISLLYAGKASVHLRPIVTFRNHQSLKQAFHGDIESALREAALLAGALQVGFTD